MAAARAEARRKAILSRGTDRLAKLTTSARGEDAPAYMHDDPPLPSFAGAAAPNARNFLGEESSNMPTPPRGVSPSPSPTPPATQSSQTRKPSGRTATSSTANTSSPFDSPMGRNMGMGGTRTPPDPSVWLPEQQQQFMQALLAASSGAGSTAGSTGSGGLPLSSPIGDSGPFDPNSPPMDNPFAALMGMAGAGGPGGPGAGMFPPGMSMPPGMGMGVDTTPPKPKSRLQKALPILHLVVMWVMLAYFVFWAEPRAYAKSVPLHGSGSTGVVGMWDRWALLGKKSELVKNGLGVFEVHIVPFFWAFTTLQIVLHSLRIFSGFDTPSPPTLLALALPHLPPPIPSLVMNGLKYMQMGGLFLDDLAGIVVGLGFVVYFSGWVKGVAI